MARVTTMLQEPGGSELCHQVRNRLANLKELDDDQAMRLGVLNVALKEVA